MSLARKASIVVLGRVLTTVVDLASAIAIVRLLSKTDFAIVSYLLVVYQTCRYLAILGFPDSVFYFFERISTDLRRAFILQTTSLMVMTALVASFVIATMQWWAPVALSQSWTTDEIQTIQALAPWLALTALLEIPTWPVSNILLALDRQKHAAIYELSTSLLSFAGLIGPLLLGLPILWSIYGLLIYAMFRCTASIVWMLSVLPPGTGWVVPNVIREQIRYSLSLGLSIIIARLNKLADKFIVAAILPAAALADYTVGAQEIPIITVIPFALGSVLMSRYVKLAMNNRREALTDLWHEAIRRTSLIVVPAGVFFIFFAQEFIIAIFGSTYHEAVLPFQIYTVIVLHRVTSYFGLMQSFGDTQSIVRISGFLLLSNVILSVPMTWIWGIVGTATATAIANLLGWVVILRVLGNHLGVPAIQVIPFPFYLRVLACALLSGLLTLVGRSVFFSNGEPLIVLVICAFCHAAIFIATGTVLGIHSPRIRYKIWSVLRWKV